MKFEIDEQSQLDENFGFFNSDLQPRQIIENDFLSSDAKVLPLNLL